MFYNKNIILGIFQNEFRDSLEWFIERIVLDLDEDDFEFLFDKEVDYSLLDYVEEMHILDYEVNIEGDRQHVHGELEALAVIDGYQHWEEDDIRVAESQFWIAMSFSFYEKNEQYENLTLEQL